jgi:pimeloyl-ACP methyl ester carboxylesterase
MIDWQELRQHYPATWVDSFERSAVRGKAINLSREDLLRFDFTPGERERFVNLPAKGAELLEKLRQAGWLERKDHRECPICHFFLGDDAPPDNCPNIESERGPHAYTDDGDEGPLEVRLYSRPGIDRRDVGWLLALHGMNTRGAWQESFNWLVSTSYGRMVPVAIYKYGAVRPGVLSRRRQRTLMKRLVARIERVSREVAKIIDDPRPDVIAHSFGTFLLGHALHRHPKLRVGRVVTLGCILRPDFDWVTLVQRGQVDAVLNHFGTKDFWARIAHYAIPDAGPAGRRGFDFYERAWPEAFRPEGQRRLFNVRAEGLRHSDFFQDAERGSTLARLFAEVWQPFLTTKNAEDLARALPAEWPAERWRQARWPRRALVGGWRRVPHTLDERKL